MLVALTLQLLFATLSAQDLGLGTTSSSLDWHVAAGVEGLLAFFLMFVITAVAIDGRAEGALAGVAIGGTVTMGALVGGPLTGGSMNPARSLGPALISGDTSQLALYLIAPVLGALDGAATYRWVQDCPEEPSTSAEGCC